MGIETQEAPAAEPQKTQKQLAETHNEAFLAFTGAAKNVWVRDGYIRGVLPTTPGPREPKWFTAPFRKQQAIARATYQKQFICGSVRKKKCSLYLKSARKGK